MPQMTIKIPESAFMSLKLPEDQWPAFFRSTVAIALYREGRISKSKTKELAGLENKWEIIRLLNERGIDFSYTARDAKEDLET
jgi:predicted HTH domain antitoxin